MSSSSAESNSNPMVAERGATPFPSGHHELGIGPMGSPRRKSIALKKLDLPTLFSPTMTFIPGDSFTSTSWKELKLFSVSLPIRKRDGASGQNVAKHPG